MELKNKIPPGLLRTESTNSLDPKHVPAPQEPAGLVSAPLCLLAPSSASPACFAYFFCQQTQFYIMTAQIQWLTVISVSLLKFLRR